MAEGAERIASGGQDARSERPSNRNPPSAPEPLRGRAEESKKFAMRTGGEEDKTKGRGLLPAPSWLLPVRLVVQHDDAAGVLLHAAAHEVHATRHLAATVVRPVPLELVHARLEDAV